MNVKSGIKQQQEQQWEGKCPGFVRKVQGREVEQKKKKEKSVT